MNKVEITIEPPEDHPEYMDVREAMRRVEEFFDLVTDANQKDVVWNLAYASTNSPLTVGGEAFHVVTKASAFSLIEPQVRQIEEGFLAVTRFGELPEDFPEDKREIADAFLKAGLNGSGTSRVRFGENRPTVQITREVSVHYAAKRAQTTAGIQEYLYRPVARREFGSVEGRIVELSTDHNEPSVRLKDSNTGREFSCRINAATREELENKIKAKDVWDHQRLRVKGEIAFDVRGQIIRIYGGDVRFLQDKSVEIAKIRDRNFTEGYSAEEYLDRLRDGDFGG